MLVVKSDLSCAVYSVGKTGSSSLLNCLDSNWHGVGEFSPDFMFNLAADYYEKLYADRKASYVDQFDAINYIGSTGADIYCLIRNPWQRYVSGIKEILQDSISALGDEMFRTVWQHLMNNPTVLVDYIDRLYYLSEHKPVKDKPSQFVLHTNYHTRNWLHEVECLISKYDAKLVLAHELDSFITSLGLEPGARQNVSNPRDIERIQTALINTVSYSRNSFVIRDYVNQDIQIFNSIVPAEYVTALL